MPRLTTEKARNYKPAIEPKDYIPGVDVFRKSEGVLYSFDASRIRIQHNKAFTGAVAILIDNVVVSLRDSFEELTHVVGTAHYHGVKESYPQVASLYEELSGQDEGKQFWFDK